MTLDHPELTLKLNTEGRTFVPSTHEGRCAEQFGLFHGISQSPAQCPHSLPNVQLPFER